MPEKQTISDYPIKPRRTRGTYSYKNRNRVSAVLLAAASLFGIAYTFLPSTNKISNYFQQEYSENSEEYKIKQGKLAPFSLDDNLEASTGAITIIDSADSKAARAGMGLNDPLTITSAQ